MMNDAEAREILYRRRLLAEQILNSESFMWLMSGSDHAPAWVEAIRPAYNNYRELGGGFNPRLDKFRVCEDCSSERDVKQITWDGKPAYLCQECCEINGIEVL